MGDGYPQAAHSHLFVPGSWLDIVVGIWLTLINRPVICSPGIVSVSVGREANSSRSVSAGCPQVADKCKFWLDYVSWLRVGRRLCTCWLGIVSWHTFSRRLHICSNRLSQLVDDYIHGLY